MTDTADGVKRDRTVCWFCEGSRKVERRQKSAPFLLKLVPCPKCSGKGHS